MHRSPHLAQHMRLATAALGMTVLATACGGGAGGVSGGGSPYTLGAVVPLSGVNQTYGNAYRKAIDMCVDYVNKNMQLKKDVKVKYADGQALPGPSVTGMTKVVNVDAALAVMTGFSAVTKALAPVANREKVPLFNGGASSPDLQGLGDYVFNNIPLANQQIPAAISYAVKKQGLNKWFVLYSNETLGLSMVKAIKESLPKAGGEIIGTAEISSTATDFGAQIAQIRAANPDLVFLASTSGGQVPIIIRQIQAAGIHTKLASYAGIDIPETLAEPGAEGMLFTSQHIDYTLKQPLTQYFTTEYKKRYPNEKNPTILQANYCSEVSIIATAIHSLEGSGTKVTGENLMKEIRHIGTFDVVGGKVTFLPDGTVNLAIDVRELSGGKLHVVDTFEPASK